MVPWDVRREKYFTEFIVFYYCIASYLRLQSCITLYPIRQWIIDRQKSCINCFPCVIAFHVSLLYLCEVLLLGYNKEGWREEMGSTFDFPRALLPEALWNWAQFWGSYVLLHHFSLALTMEIKLKACPKRACGLPGTASRGGRRGFGKLLPQNEVIFVRVSSICLQGVQRCWSFWPHGPWFFPGSQIHRKK